MPLVIPAVKSAVDQHGESPFHPIPVLGMQPEGQVYPLVLRENPINFIFAGGSVGIVAIDEHLPILPDAQPPTKSSSGARP